MPEGLGLATLVSHTGIQAAADDFGPPLLVQIGLLAQLGDVAIVQKPALRLIDLLAELGTVSSFAAHPGETHVRSE